VETRTLDQSKANLNISSSQKPQAPLAARTHIKTVRARLKNTEKWQIGTLAALMTQHLGLQAMFLEETSEMSTSGEQMIPSVETKNGWHLTLATMICLRKMLRY
jgi:hypothetical protein